MSTPRLPSLATWQSEVKNETESKESTALLEISSALNAVHQSLIISKRFDAFCNLLQKCDEYLLTNPQHNAVTNLRKHTLHFAMAIVDARNKEDLDLKIKQRAANKIAQPNYMPWHLPYSVKDKSTDTVERKQEFKQSPAKARWLKIARSIAKTKIACNVNLMDREFDQDKGVIMLSAQQRENYRVFLSNGRFKKLAWDISDNLLLENFDTFHYRTHPEINDKAIFVISLNGDFFAGSTRNCRFHHSSFLAGGSAFFAGVLTVTDGLLRFISDGSGHYCPGPRSNYRALGFLRECGLLANQPKYESYALASLKLSGASLVYHALMRKPVESAIHSTDSFDISAQAHNKILNLLLNYVAQRTKFKNDNLELDWLTKKCRNKDLSVRKIALVEEIYNEIETVRDLFTIRRIILRLERNNVHLEKLYNKTYSRFNTSDLLKHAGKIRKILREEVENHGLQVKAAKLKA